MKNLTEEINHKDLIEGDHYYIVGAIGNIGQAVYVDGVMEVWYNIGKIYDVSKFKFYSIPKLEDLIKD